MHGAHWLLVDMIETWMWELTCEHQHLSSLDKPGKGFTLIIIA
jgi:hypothetical protein